MHLVEILKFFKSLSLWEKVVAGVTVILIVGTFRFSRRKILGLFEKHKIFNWLKKNTTNKAGKQFKSTKEIVKATGIVENQVRKVCTEQKKIFPHKRKKDQWSIFGNEEKSVYEERGIRYLSD
jgi:hypothetical protein